VSTAILSVYSSCGINNKISIWVKIIKLKEKKLCKQLCILGDFNVIKKSSERKEINLEERRSGKV